MKYKVIKAIPGRYQTRRLLPGDIVDVGDDLAGRLFAKINHRRIAPHRDPGKIAPPPAELQAKINPRIDQDDDGNMGGSKSPPSNEVLTQLRAAYTEKFDKRPFNGWDEVTLREKLGV